MDYLCKMLSAMCKRRGLTLQVCAPMEAPPCVQNRQTTHSNSVTFDAEQLLIHASWPISVSFYPFLGRAHFRSRRRCGRMLGASAPKLKYTLLCTIPHTLTEFEDSRLRIWLPRRGTLGARGGRPGRRSAWKPASAPTKSATPNLFAFMVHGRPTSHKFSAAFLDLAAGAVGATVGARRPNFGIINPPIGTTTFVFSVWPQDAPNSRDDVKTET